MVHLCWKEAAFEALLRQRIHRQGAGSRDSSDLDRATKALTSSRSILLLWFEASLLLEEQLPEAPARPPTCRHRARIRWGAALRHESELGPNLRFLSSWPDPRAPSGRIQSLPRARGPERGSQLAPASRRRCRSANSGSAVPQARQQLSSRTANFVRQQGQQITRCGEVDSIRESFCVPVKELISETFGSMNTCARATGRLQSG